MILDIIPIFLAGVLIGIAISMLVFHISQD